VLSFSSLVPLLGVFLYYYYFKILFLEEVQISIWTTPQSQQPDGTDWANVKQFNIIDDPYSFAFMGEFLPICDLKNMVSTSTKDFS